jgi:predicted nucleic acid-binding protein
VSRPALLDASFLIALERETAGRQQGPARAFLPSLAGRRLVISVVTVEEILEGAADAAVTLASMQRFSIVGLHLAQAARCALIQRRSARRRARTTHGSWQRPSRSIRHRRADRRAFER